MNGLSWLIYWAGLTDKFLGLAVAALIVSGLGYVCCFFWNINATREFRSYHDEDDKIWINMSKGYKRWCLFTILISTPVIILIPSATTVYLIASSQAAEMVVKDPEMKGLINDIILNLRNKLKEEVNQK